MQYTRRAFAYLDIIFLNRNKAYGAYELRTHYPDRLRKAMYAVLFSAGLLALIPVLTSAISGKKPLLVQPQIYDTTKFDRPPIEDPKPEIEPEQTATSKPVATQKVTPPIIVEDSRADDEDILQEVDSARAIATTTIDGDTALPGDIPGPATSGNGRGWVVEGTGKRPAGGEPVVIVDILAEFPGDVREYLAGRLNYPDQAREAGIEGRVVVQFIVDEEGAISGAKVMRSIGGGCDEEALRVIRAMPRWKPAKLNGRVVKSFFSLLIKFSLE